MPVIVEQTDDGYRLIDGQRRTLAATDAKLDTIPAVVIDPLADDAGRIIRQLVVNEHREQLTDADRTAAFQTLFDLNVSADQIARKTKTPKARVETALKVAASPHAGLSE
ncbi:nuclease [Microcella alkaliphila]|uniref:Nuclease n=1 Tax=Microcella alkaliphila TaxID=279828 RepID=A0A0U4WXP6_9MICO|nr:nuclease [Microcella alkaliphila]